MNKAFSKEEIQVSKKHMKKFSPTLAIKEVQFKTTLRFHLIPVTITTIENTEKKQMFCTRKQCKLNPCIAILISTSKNPWSFLLLLILSLQQN
jgi:hypothetical protein